MNDRMQLMTLARWLARKAVKAEWKSQGRNPKIGEPAAAANVYFIKHREELLSEARAHPVTIQFRQQKQMRLARKAVIAEIRDKGRKVSSIAPEELRRLIEAYL